MAYTLLEKDGRESGKHDEGVKLPSSSLSKCLQSSTIIVAIFPFLFLVGNLGFKINFNFLMCDNAIYFFNYVILTKL